MRSLLRRLALLSGGRAEAVGYRDRSAAVAVLGHDDLLHEQLHQRAPPAARFVGVGLHFCETLAQREEPRLGGGGGQPLLLVGVEVGLGRRDEEL